MELAPCALQSCWESGAGLPDSEVACSGPGADGAAKPRLSGECGTAASRGAFPRESHPALPPGGKAEKAVERRGRPAHGPAAQDLRARGQPAWWRPFPAPRARPQLKPHARASYSADREIRTMMAGRAEAAGRPAPSTQPEADAALAAPAGDRYRVPPEGSTGPRPQSLTPRPAEVAWPPC